MINSKNYFFYVGIGLGHISFTKALKYSNSDYSWCFDINPNYLKKTIRSLKYIVNNRDSESLLTGKNGYWLESEYEKTTIMDFAERPKSVIPTTEYLEILEEYELFLQKYDDDEIVKFMIKKAFESVIMNSKDYLFLEFSDCYKIQVDDLTILFF